MNVIENKVLVLNSAWMPVDVTSVYEAVCMVFADKPRAKFVDHETYVTYDWESWVQTWQDVSDYTHVLLTPSLSLRVPEIVVLNYYSGNGEGRSKAKRPAAPKFSRRNIYLRDGNKCSYCGKKFETQDLNLDHVIPKSKGGEMTWTNIVLSCVLCNNKKGDRTPAQAGMVLLVKPTVPKYEDLKMPFGHRLKRKLGMTVPKAWEGFLGKSSADENASFMYWNAGMKE